MPLTFGQVLISRYRIVKNLAKGGFGTVYRAWDLRMNGPCALKESFDTSPAAQHQFQFEAQVLFKLKHPNLPRVNDYFLEGGVIPCLVMEFVEGESLFTKLQQANGPLSVEEVMGWMLQVCEALDYLHKQNPPVIHRDIKPENIMVTPQGDVKLLDFGISKVYDPAKKTASIAHAATPGYAPPEQYWKSGTDTRSDIYALGATLYALLAGKEPPESIKLSAGVTRMPALRSLNPAVSIMAQQTIEKAMELRPENRFQSVSDLQTALFALTTPQPVQFPPVLPPKKAAPPLWVWITGGCGLVAVGAIIIGLIIAVGTGRVGRAVFAIGSTSSGTTSLTPTASKTPIPILTNTSTSIPTPEPGATRVSEKDGMVLVYVPEGKFEMGSTKGSANEVPVHTIYLDAYWIDRTEVTNGMYEQCVAAGACDPPSKKAPSTRKDGYYGISKYDDYPVVFVDWYNAKAYCEWTGRRLPNEAEWEKAARGTNGRTYPWGENINCGLANYRLDSQEYCRGETSKVGSYPDGASPYGALDMAGNVFEWVNTLYDIYPYDPDSGRESSNASGDRVLRGGAVGNYPFYIRSSLRASGNPGVGFGQYGFRCATSGGP